MSANTITVSAIQMNCLANQRQYNLNKASGLVQQAVAQGAQLVLLPELMPGGYLLTEEIWQTAEPFEGESMAWLKATATQHRIYLGTTFLERDGEDFYNSFVLINPDGKLAGRVRKSPPASVEAYFFRSGSDAHYIDTEIGRIGVAICYESLLYQHIQALYEANVNLILQPASAPTPAARFPLRQKDADAFDTLLRNGPAYYARTLGVPVVMANKAGPLKTAMPGGLPELDSRFPGASCIADSDGTIKQQLGCEEDEVIVATVTLDKMRKQSTPPPCFGKRWAMRVPWYAFIWRYTQWLGEKSYAKNERRKASVS